MSRQIISTNGQGRAQAEGRTYGIAAVVVAVVVLLIFFALAKSGVGDHSIDQQVTGAATVSSGTATGGSGSGPASLGK